MHVLPAFSFTVTFTKAELRLIGLALSGRLTDRADLAEAQDLNRKLLEHRRRLLVEEMALVDGALAKPT